MRRQPRQFRWSIWAEALSADPRLLRLLMRCHNALMQKLSYGLINVVTAALMLAGNALAQQTPPPHLNLPMQQEAKLEARIPLPLQPKKTK